MKISATNSTTTVPAQIGAYSGAISHTASTPMRLPTVPGVNGINPLPKP